MSDVGRIIMDIEKKLEAVEGPPPIRIMDCDLSVMSDLYGMFGLKFEPAYKVNSGTAMLNRLRIAALEGKVRCTNLKFQLRTGVFNRKQTDYLAHRAHRPSRSNRRVEVHGAQSPLE